MVAHPRPARLVKRLLLSVIGEPGVGKSTAINSMWKALGVTQQWEHQAGRGLFYVERFDPHAELIGVELGRDRSEFPGSDGLSMSVLPAACDWITGPGSELRLVVAEGDRLASPRMYAAARSTDRKVLVIWLNGPVAAAVRRAARGTAQNDRWVRGRQTKVRRVARSQDAVELPADRQPMRLGLDIAMMVTAVLE
jgi:hypothetical protein